MNILMYGWEFPPHISGGLGVACYGIVKGLLNCNINLTLVLPYADEDHQHQEAGLNIINALKLSEVGQLRIQSINTLLRPYQTTERYQAMKSNHAPVYGQSLWEEIHRYAEIAGQLGGSVDHDLIHVHDWLTILAGIHAKKISGKPLIFHVHALEVDRSGNHLCQAVFDIEQLGMQQADQIIAVSQYTKNIMIKRYAIAAEKIFVIHNGISLTTSKKLVANAPNHKSSIVLFLGRVTHQKGPYYFIKAAEKILSKRRDIQFVIAGEGDQLAAMIEKVAALGLSSHIHFTGFLDQPAVTKIYALSKVYVMPSVSEPFGISCLEALAHNLPVIISKQSGVAEVLNHSLQVDFWDTDALAAKIIATIDFPALSIEMQKHSQKKLKYLNWNEAAKKITRVYQHSLLSYQKTQRKI